jgi:hypothetical protein
MVPARTKDQFSDGRCVLYENDRKANFTDVTRAAGIGMESSFTAWGPGIVDLDDDGFPDILVVTGSVYPEVGKTLPRYTSQSRRI